MSATLAPPQTHRERNIVQLLERHAELTEPIRAGNGQGAGGGVALMPHEPSCVILKSNPPYCSCSRRSVVELERLLVRMRDERRSQWWHVTERYVRCTYVTRDVEVKRKGKNGKTARVVERQLCVDFHPGVRAEKVRRGVEWLADNWADRAGPMLPIVKDVAA